MAFTHIWHQLYLHRQKITVAGLLALALLGGTTASAQRKIRDLNKPGYDERPVHYGFYLALPYTGYNLQHSQAYADQFITDPNGTNAVSVNTKKSLGFYTGLVLNVRIADYLDARFVPGVGFYNRSIEFANVRPEDGGEPIDDTQSINSTMIELPVLLKYKAKRRSNYRPYLVAGIKPGIDLGKGKNTVDDEARQLQVESFDLALEYGIGLDIFYPYFKFAPELRFSHGLLNQHIPVANSDYSNFIQKTTNHNISLILFFE
ncbi:PorT family protein [Pontibacter sp. E15-1]|uniref:type IX secretion/gliding motility protein PorT/SprT n=1 Tax=Pontibacter sp. E15-1 TaxID=2919918 RepID=UPI001F501944|nr:porin family protein [Pontibacter sp. E15-1]MCJ8166463.1 PorT family protein [Pontibacter sp. E15-1]